MTKFSQNSILKKNELQFRMAGGNDCISVNTLPGICEQLAIFYFQETNQTVCVKSAIISSLGFSPRYFQ